MRLPAHIPAHIMVLLIATALGGCTSVSETFPGSTPEQVWTALIAAARTPDYTADPDVTRRWHVQDNEVAVFEDEARLEIFRRVQRVLHTESVRPRMEDRTWRFQVTLDSTSPPRAKLLSRGAAIPTHALDEAHRYFDDVWNLLGGRPEEIVIEEVVDVPMANDAAMEAQPDETVPIVDIDDIVPQ